MVFLKVNIRTLKKITTGQKRLLEDNCHGAFHKHTHTHIYISDVWSFINSTLMMEAEENSETLVFNTTFTRLIAREDFGT
jgi:hypothetical protein